MKAYYFLLHSTNNFAMVRFVKIGRYIKYLKYTLPSMLYIVSTVIKN